MSKPPFNLEKAHRWFAIEWNNASWDALESDSLDDVAKASALHKAHASVAHWREAGNDVNWVRGLCLLANAEAQFGAAGSAQRFAAHAQQLAEGLGDELADWDHAFLADASARAAAAAIRDERARENVDEDRCAALEAVFRQERERAEALGNAIASEDEKEFFFRWFRQG